MATFVKRGTQWRAQVSKNGQRPSASFDTKAEATAWAARIETEIDSQRLGTIPRKTYAELMQRYSEEVSSKKRSARNEQNRIAFYLREEPDLFVKWIADLRPADFAALRDRRLRVASGETIRRDFNVLSGALSVAVKEWGWLHTNPMTNVKRPPPGKSRSRLITQAEVGMVLAALQYTREGRADRISQRLGVAFLFALETAMRVGEILALKPEHVDTAARVATLLMTKNGDTRRVPLSTEAVRLLGQLPPVAPGELVFAMSSSSADANFRKALKLTPIEDLHFHDTRHEAITRLAKRIEVLDLARMTGHRNINELLTYYNESAESISLKLA